MPQKGKSNNPNGRKKGVPNKATTQAREVIAKFVDGNIGQLSGWLEQVANGIKDENDEKYIVPPNPKGAIDSLMSVLEYHIPRLARHDHTSTDGSMTPQIPLIVLSDGKDYQFNIGKDVSEGKVIEHEPSED